VVERLSFSFQKINVEYVPQGADGQARGSMMFDAEIV
jgi:type VI secretion system secreted protein Hcp